MGHLQFFLWPFWGIIYLRAFFSWSCGLIYHREPSFICIDAVGDSPSSGNGFLPTQNVAGVRDEGRGELGGWDGSGGRLWVGPYL